MAENIETRISSEQAKEAIYQAHLSKDAIGKIKGLQSSASEIDATVNADFEVGMTIDTVVDSLKYGFDLHHKSQQGLASDRIAFTIHNYTDSKTMQLDNVGSGDILRLKNAHNAINRPDKGENYNGNGKFLVFENASGEQLRVFNSGEWYFNYVPINLIQTKADDGNYAVVIKSLVEHVKAFDFGFLKIWLGTTSATMKFSKEPIYQINNVNIMKLQADRTYFYEKIQLAKGIVDKNGSTGTAGQVLTALGDGTCIWQTPL